jgi:hypothetical protein
MILPMTELVHALLAHYASHGANELTIAPRWYPYGELILIIEDKVKVGARKFGFKVNARAKEAATAFLDHMIAKGAFATKQNDFGGQMHQYQPDAWRAALKELQQTDPIIREAQGAGPEFWADKFATLTA